MAKNKKFNTMWIQSDKPNNWEDPNHDLVHKQKSFDLPKVKNQIKNSCNIAWNSLTIDEKGRVFTCICDGHVPFPVGYVQDFATFNEIFSSPQAQLTQQSILKKEYEYCATKFCGIESENKIYSEENIFLIIQTDTSCNITCPSCRERMIFINDETIIYNKHKQAEQMFKWINSTDKNVIVEFGGGEPLASLIYLKMLELFSTNNRVKFRIRTNGLLLKAHLPKFNPNILKNTLLLSISIDASSQQTYEKVRRGSKWNVLLDNLDYAKSLNFKFNRVGNFVVQKSNLDDVIPFIDLCKNYNLDPNFWVLQDWGTWHKFEEQCVHIPNSPDYKKFKEIFSNPIFAENNISMSAIKPWL
jgi:organic radical activating enzyme